MLKLARIISNILNPLIIFVLIVTILMYHSTGNVALTIRWLVISMTFSVLVAGGIFWAIKKGVFSNFDVSKKRERPMLFFVAGLVIAVFLTLGIILQITHNLIMLLLVSLFGVALYSVTTLKVKASVHLGSLMVLATILTFLVNNFFVVLYLLVPILGWARVKEREHTVSEVIVGSILGLVLGFMLLVLIK